MRFIKNKVHIIYAMLLLKYACDNEAIAATDKNHEAIIQLRDAGLLKCLGEAPRGEYEGKKVYIITDEGNRRIEAYEAQKTQTYTRIAAISGLVAAVCAFIGLFLH